MDKDTIKSTWNESMRKLKMRYSWLTDNDLKFEEGKKDIMLGHLQIKLGKTKEQLQNIIAAL